jgi:hypothetical protein
LRLRCRSVTSICRCIHKNPTFPAFGAIVVSAPTRALRGRLAGLIEACAIGPHGAAEVDRHRRYENRKDAGNRWGE